MRKAPTGCVFEPWSPVDGTVWGRLRRCSLVRGSMSLNLGFENLKIPIISSWLSLLHACGSSCELSAFSPSHHACHLLPSSPAMVDACWQQHLRTKEKNEQALAKRDHCRPTRWLEQAFSDRRS